ncbi:TPA: lysozyme inhibitor LprI family protein [Serratia marcescens]
MPLKKKFLCIVIFTLSSSNSFALSCASPINSYDRTYCAGSEMIQLDQNLNEQYKKTINSLIKEERKTVKNAQIRWIRNRDNDCSSDGEINVSCVNEKMRKRIETLRQIERECKASGCNNELLDRDD